MKNIKKLTGIMMAGALAFSVPVPAIASGFDTSSLEALIDSGVDAVFSDPAASFQALRRTGRLAP